MTRFAATRVAGAVAGAAIALLPPITPAASIVTTPPAPNRASQGPRLRRRRSVRTGTGSAAGSRRKAGPKIAAMSSATPLILGVGWDACGPDAGKSGSTIRGLLSMIAEPWLYPRWEQRAADLAGGGEKALARVEGVS